MKLVTGNSNLTLAKKISDYVDIDLSNCDVKRFADKEIFVEMQENVRGEDVFIIQSTSFGSPSSTELNKVVTLLSFTILGIDIIRQVSDSKPLTKGL